ncbi:MAG: transketolase C-terminal domain-containing protein [Acutalibacteraceae bacterium]
MRKSLSSAVYVCDSLAVVRYPRGGELYRPSDFESENISYDVYGSEKCKNLLITYGRLFSYACKAKEKLAEKGIEVCILKLCRIKPIDGRAVEFASKFRNVWFFEEGIKNGGIARNFSDMLMCTDFDGIYHIKAINDKFVKQMSVSEALNMLKLDDEGMVEIISTELKDKD